MSQQDQHLTTEQLSTFLDQQLTPEEQASYSAHLLECEQCRQALDNLQQTVNLLRSFPQLAVPRSFALPANFKITSADADNYAVWNDEKEEMPAYGNTQKQIVQVTTNRKSASRKLPTPFRRTLRTLSALAAIVGIFFALSGFAATLSFHSGGSAASSTGMQTSSKSAPDTTQPTKIGSKAQQHTQVNGSADNATPMVQSPSTPHALTTPNQSSGSSNSTETSPPGTDSASSWLTLPFLNFNLPGVRLAIGILLVFLGGMGFRLFARR